MCAMTSGQVGLQPAISAVEFPDPSFKRRFDSLVGVESVTDTLESEMALILRPTDFKRWAAANHISQPLLDLLGKRSPLFILAGDVGTGKTEIAETIGDRLAREMDMPVTLFRMGLGTRGSGLVGEMSRLIAEGFEEVLKAARRWSGPKGSRAAGILFIDEADALAQSRELGQMHHEDRAGVNALIRGIDDLTRAEVPVAMILATNRLSSLDPAVRRRAVRTFELGRPSDLQREALFRKYLVGFRGFEAGLAQLVSLTGAAKDGHAFTYSDLTQRLIPSALLAAFPSASPQMHHLISTAESMQATPPFVSQ